MEVVVYQIHFGDLLIQSYVTRLDLPRFELYLFRVI